MYDNPKSPRVTENVIQTKLSSATKRCGLLLFMKLSLRHKVAVMKRSGKPIIKYSFQKCIYLTGNLP